MVEQPPVFFKYLQSTIGFIYDKLRRLAESQSLSLNFIGPIFNCSSVRNRHLLVKEHAVLLVPCETTWQNSKSRKARLVLRLHCRSASRLSTKHFGSTLRYSKRAKILNIILTHLIKIIQEIHVCSHWRSEHFKCDQENSFPVFKRHETVSMYFTETVYLQSIDMILPSQNRRRKNLEAKPLGEVEGCSNRIFFVNAVWAFFYSQSQNCRR